VRVMRLSSSPPNGLLDSESITFFLLVWVFAISMVRERQQMYQYLGRGHNLWSSATPPADLFTNVVAVLLAATTTMPHVNEAFNAYFHTYVKIHHDCPTFDGFGTWMTLLLNHNMLPFQENMTYV
jgi:hypothetical protein